MKKILISLMAIALVVGLVGAGTVAYFSDTETSTGNTFTAGTLDLNLDGGNANVVKFTVADVKPGDSGGGTWTVANVGSILGYLDLESISFSETIGVTTDAELADEPTSADTTQLGNYLLAHLYIDADNSGTFTTGDTDIFGTAAAPAAINTIAANYELNLALAASNGTNYIRLDWNVPSATDNRIQGDTVTLNITFELAQTTGQ